MSETLMLLSGSTLWVSQYSNGPKKFQFGPRRNVPSTISVTHSTKKPNMKMVMANLRFIEGEIAVALRLKSMYGMAIRPTMIKVGSTTPAIHGSK